MFLRKMSNTEIGLYPLSYKRGKAMPDKIKAMFFFGTRPEAIKMAPIIKKIEEGNSGIEPRVVVTAQHRQMLDQVLDTFDIEVDYDLNIMRSNQSLSDITERAVQGFEKVIREEDPHMILVQGDTTTAFVGGLVANYHKIPVGHVEAGLRSFDKFNPFPEEINRKLISVLTDIHFVPTSVSKENLLREGVPSDHIFITGNTVIDALFRTVKMDFDVEESFPLIDFQKRIILVTAHRRENLGQYMRQIFEALGQISREYQDVEIVFPVHLNPRIGDLAGEILGDLPNVHLLKPLDYLSFVKIMEKSYFILTDSGGIQEEAPSLGKPVLVLRKVTERPEAVKAGTVRVIGTKKEDIIREMKNLLANEEDYMRMSQAINPYGDGRASERIISILRYCFQKDLQRPRDFIAPGLEGTG
ncbi:UDP-N-acetylglucosamine 2-epimerase (non-hydrolysing) [Candidatus Hakubella thermalkaliphila]|uniref:UDP-N-acetylglucosamine 2-epimerase (non-hydrolyzing) n=7 Tax=Candidatus Hakubella thermalkaliphila TaxID=2754717 RepID=A0A6V8PEK9_9ACTN|nr:UDP-N-acetylglucosamine 2-epimerase (non-hydrolysing) [Candidatus Hakubella thermalkaliphila]GFP30074.1 UDP-N-acetylglucosamine 2-epimerase (non-hydrolysing) [Candidatus Hakubella thermalkaliphila]GFP36450.1 UDP-N-acetylglucosamine 2-epimerase (non-hydrolysing) [Candidatus Hakubella thermalkaliphila]GFP41011.1 UDP-N-acetylglucosamine 2-epimerase (non-hydrolysing) [Candidatus Hakubella thermalkaliphila]